MPIATPSRVRPPARKRSVGQVVNREVAAGRNRNPRVDVRHAGYSDGAGRRARAGRRPVRRSCSFRRRQSARAPRASARSSVSGAGSAPGLPRATMASSALRSTSVARRRGAIRILRKPCIVTPAAFIKVADRMVKAGGCFERHAGGARRGDEGRDLFDDRKRRRLRSRRSAISHRRPWRGEFVHRQARLRAQIRRRSADRRGAPRRASRAHRVDRFVAERNFETCDRRPIVAACARDHFRTCSGVAITESSMRSRPARLRAMRSRSAAVTMNRPSIQEAAPSCASSYSASAALHRQLCRRKQPSIVDQALEGGAYERGVGVKSPHRRLSVRQGPSRRFAKPVA